MAETVYDRVNDYGRVKITLASPNDIRSWSFGEVKKPETINYRTYRPEKDGLFCERIFGPEKDYECACGKYKGTKHKGIICDRCGVKVTHSRVRRKRMGHINLAAPVVHIWFFKTSPSRLGTLLDMKASDLEKIIYFQDYVVVEPGTTDLHEKQVLTEEEYRNAVATYGASGFDAQMGADAIRTLLHRLDLNALAKELRDDLAATKSKQKQKDLSKRLKLVEQVRGSENDPTWMILDVIPVIPPDLRPLVLLDNGNFATSDLNDLYRRIINRNNRLKKLMDLNAPEVIIRNEKRMLQQAVDALFDNGRCRRPVLGSSNRPLKSLTDMIKGKQGRFRENLLGKRVDYSARSVIVVGPDLKLNQCGLPKKIALELYQPFIIRRLKEQGLTDTIKSAKRMLERRDPEVWDILEQVIYQHPVLLNRAPTLHRMGIQAFEPVLVEGNAIRIHPLVCTGYNADFDGDQMAVHLPLSVEAQAEAHVLMLSTNNIFSPASGRPIMSPSQDIVMGVYFITFADEERVKEANAKLAVAREKGGRYPVRRFRNVEEAMLAWDHGQIELHEPIEVRLMRFDQVVSKECGTAQPLPDNRRILTTIGRVIFADRLPTGMPFYNCTLGKKGCAAVIDDCYNFLGRPSTIDLLDSMKEIGFRASTLSGLSIAITDLRIPAEKHDLIAAAQKRADSVERSYDMGAITARERHNQLLDFWSVCRENVTKKLLETLKNDRRDVESGVELPTDGSKGGMRYLNPVFLMANSGARGNVSQMQQLAGMRGLMAKPSGEIIETPIRANFREGLNVLEYFSSTHGARKGLADTALKTADSGYLTRKLYDVAQSAVILEHDCGTRQGIVKRTIKEGDEIVTPLRDVIVGRVASQTVNDPRLDEVVVEEGELITPDLARRIEELGLRLGFDAIQVRSPLTCLTARGVCALCYGMDMATGHLVEEGMAVGTIAAQSIGEPGTQLTMRTFHTGGVAARSSIENKASSPHAGIVELRDCNEVVVGEGDDRRTVSLKKGYGYIVIKDERGFEFEPVKVPYGARIHVKNGDRVKRGDVLVEWDLHMTPTLAERAGRIKFQDVVTGETVREEIAKGKTTPERIVTEHTGNRTPTILIVDEGGTTLELHYLRAKMRIEVTEGENVSPGQLLAREPKEVKGSEDIVGGLPRVTEIFEARQPKDPAVLAEISGRVELPSEKRKGKMVIRVVGEGGVEVDHLVPQAKNLRVHTGDWVEAGDPLIEGPVVPQDLLKIKGEEALFTYMLEEVQAVYRKQGVGIADKHIEVILRQMLSKVRVREPNDTVLLPNEVIDKHHFRAVNGDLAKKIKITDPGGTRLPLHALVDRDEFEEANAQAMAEDREPAKGRRAKPAKADTLLLGITKASLQAESFLSGASFQETTKVLTEAALRGAVDDLKGLKENVLLGHLIPAGTGFDPYAKMRVKRLVELPTPEEDELMLRADAAAEAERLGAHRPEVETEPRLGEAGRLEAEFAAGTSDG